MRLTLTLPEIERGSSLQTGIKDRILELRMLAHKKEPVAISPVKNHDGKIICVVLLLGEPTVFTETSVKIKFRPIWNKTFTLCSSNKDSLIALICEFENGQYWIDRAGSRTCKLTLNGNGTDPVAVYNSAFVLGDLLAASERSEILRNAIQFIHQNC